MTDGNGGSLIPDSLAGTLPDDTEHYAYDANGNMTRDHVSGITAMSYNRINLPETITVIDSGKVSNVSYAYTSDGTKQRASVTDASGESLTKDWCSNLVYLNGELDRILIPGGYIKDGSYRFFLTDHLGSVRAVADSEGNVLETIDYYPYGQEISDGRASGNGAAAFDETLQPYRFNGKESQSFAGLPYLDYGARFYHPQSTRWTTMDPLAEKYYFLSPYAYCSGNPVNFVDPDGRRWVDKDGFVVWGTKGPTSFATDAQKDLGFTMRKSQTGIIQLQKLIDAPFDVVVDVNEYSYSSAFGKAEYRGKGAKTPKSDVKITIFKKSAKRRSGYTDGKITEMEAMAINFGHEIEHLSEEAFSLDAENAPKEEKEKAPNKISDKMTQDYINKLENVETIVSKATTGQ